MWVLRVYNLDDDELVAEHEFPGLDQFAFERILGFAPSPFGSTPLAHEDLMNLDMALSQLREPGRESWHNRAVVLDFDADPNPVPRETGHGSKAALR